jgi:glucose dehydrogenase
VWKCHSTGTDKEVCITPDTNKAHPEYGTYGKDLGIHTYPNDEWTRGGGSPWAWYSYDPELKLVYASTGNPGNWSPTTRCGEDTHEKCNSGKWDNKWSMTIFARKIDTGEAVWAYQMTPFDQWDFDGVNENILVNMPCRRQGSRSWCTSIATASPMCLIAPTARCCARTSS